MTDVEKSKETVIRFYNALARGDIATLEELGRPDYIQHNPNFETGSRGLVKMIRSRPPRAADAPPVPPLEFVRIIAEGDFVMTLRRILPARERDLPPEKEMANVDIFRVQDGKVAEHWDYQERFPRGNTPPKNQNGRFWRPLAGGCPACRLFSATAYARRCCFIELLTQESERQKTRLAFRGRNRHVQERRGTSASALTSPK